MTFLMLTISGLLIWLAGFVAIRGIRLWTASIARKQEHYTEFFKHANAVYDNAVGDVPEVVSNYLEDLVQLMSNKRFVVIVIHMLSRPRSEMRPLTADTQKAIQALSEQQAHHMAHAFLHAALFSAECSFALGRTHRRMLEIVLNNEPEPEAMSQRVISLNWDQNGALSEKCEDAGFVRA